MKFPSFVRGWETPAQRDRRRKEEERRRARQIMERKLNQMDEERRSVTARHSVTARLNADFVSLRRDAGLSRAADDDRERTKLGLREEGIREGIGVRTRRLGGYADPSDDRGLSFGDIAGRALQVAEAGELPAGRIVQTATKTLPFGTQAQFGGSTKAGGEEFKKFPMDVEVALKSAVGGDKDRERLQVRMQEIGLPQRIVGDFLFNPINLIPGLGFANDLDTLRFVKGINKFRKARVVDEALMSDEDVAFAIEKLRGMEPGTYQPIRGAADEDDILGISRETGEIVPRERAIVPRPLQLEQTKQIVPRETRTDFEMIFTPDPDVIYLREPVIHLPGRTPTPEQLDDFISQTEAVVSTTGITDPGTINLLEKMKAYRRGADELDRIKRAAKATEDPLELRELERQADELRAQTHAEVNLIDGVDKSDDLWEGFVRRAFVEPRGWTDLGKLWEQGSKVPGIRAGMGFINRTYTLANRSAGHLILAYRKGIEELGNDLILRTQTIKGIPKPWKYNRQGIEEVTGKPLHDVLENWDTYRPQFIGHEKLADMDKFRAEYSAVVDYTRETAEKLGLKDPNLWNDTDIVFREVTGIEGIDVTRRGSAIPSALKERVHELAEEGIAKNIDYATDLVHTLETKTSAILQYALRKKLYNEVNKMGRLPHSFIDKELKRAVVEAQNKHLYAKRVLDYVKQGARGEPPKPVLRGSQGVEVPQRLQEILDDATQISRNRTGRDRRDWMKSLREETEGMVSRYSEELQAARAAKTKAVNSVSRVRQPASAFPDAKSKLGPGSRRIVEVKTGPTLQTQQRLFDIETYETLAENLPKSLKDDTTMKFLGGVDKIVNTTRMAQTGVDPGFAFLHGLGLMGVDFMRIARNPLRVLKPHESVWARGMFNFTKTLFFGEKAAARYWSRTVANNPDVARDFVRYVGVFNEPGHASHEIVEAFTQAGLIQSIPGVGQAANRFGNGMANFLNSGMWDTFKAFHHTAKGDERRLMELGAFTRNMAGQFNANSVSLGPIQRTFERTFLMYAPSFVKSAIALVAKSTDFGSYGGRLAMQGIMGTGAASVTLLTGAIIAKHMAENGITDPTKVNFDQVKGEFLESINPTSPGTFMSLRIGDNYYGVGGSLRSMFNLGASLTKDMVTGDWDALSPIDLNSKTLLNSDNPIVRFARSKASYITGSTINYITGEDYLGYEFESPTDAFLSMGEETTPFGLQAYINAEGGMRGKVMAGLASWSGFRTYPVSKRDLYEETAVETFGVESFDDIRGTPQLEDARQDPENYPELAAAWQEYEGDLRAKGDELQAHRDFAENYKTNTRDVALRDLASGIKWNRPGGGETYKTDRRLHMEAARQVIEQDLANRGIDPEDFKDATNLDAQLASEYYELDPDDFQNQLGEIDWDSYYAKQETILNRMSTSARQLVKDPANFFSDPVVVETEKRRLAANEDLDTWFNTSKYKGLTAEQSTQVDEVLAQASALAGEYRAMGADFDRRTALLMLDPSGIDQEILNAALTLTLPVMKDQLTLPDKDLLVMANPDMVIFNEWLFDTLTTEDQVRWLELHRFN